MGRRVIAASLSLVLGAGWLTLGAEGTRAGEASKIIARCTHGESLAGFSQDGYREALKKMPTEVSEYSDCANLIRKAELAAAGGGGEAGASSSSVPIALTPNERRQVQNAHSHGATAIPVAGKPIKPGVVHADIASVTSALPSSLLAVLALLAAGAVTFLATEAYRHVRAGRDR